MSVSVLTSRQIQTVSRIIYISSRNSSDEPGWRRVRVGVDRRVANPFSFLVDKSQRLLEQRRLGIAFRYGSLKDVKTVFVHVDRSKGTGAIGIGQLQLMSFNQIGVVIREKCNLRVP